MAVESLIVTSTDGTTDLTFEKVSQNGYSSRWAYTGNTGSAKYYFDIDHVIKPSGSIGTDVHTVTLRREVIDNDTQKLYVSKVSFQASIPRTESVNATDIANDISRLACLFHKNFMSTFVFGGTTSGDYNVTGPFNPVRA
jgi:hypothetical protein